MTEPFDDRGPPPTEGGQALDALVFLDLGAELREGMLARGEAARSLGETLRLVELETAIDVVSTPGESLIARGTLAETFGRRQRGLCSFAGCAGFVACALELELGARLSDAPIELGERLPRECGSLPTGLLDPRAAPQRRGRRAIGDCAGRRGLRRRERRVLWSSGSPRRGLR